MQPMRQVTRVTTVKEEYVVTRQDIIGVLRSKGVAVPDHAEVVVLVPGGGDWSNMNLDIDRDTQVKVKFTETKTETE
jgi:hypothetical protein